MFEKIKKLGKRQKTFIIAHDWAVDRVRLILYTDIKKFRWGKKMLPGPKYMTWAISIEMPLLRFDSFKAALERDGMILEDYDDQGYIYELKKQQ